MLYSLMGGLILGNGGMVAIREYGGWRVVSFVAHVEPEVCVPTLI